jgi:tyrosyl-tRNA synthetase
MTAVKPGLLEDLTWRGLVYQKTSEDLAQILDQSSHSVYVGFDPTADSLHVGSLVQILTLKRFQDYGHRPFAIVGGATGRIGDPSGKTAERQLLTDDILDKNIRGIQGVLSRFLNFSAGGAKLLNNADFHRGLTFIDFLRDIGKHFTINHMMAKESVRSRLEDREHGISYTEMSYMLLQAFDYYHLYEKEGVRLQFGGSDQWGNITAGIELIRKKHAQKNDQKNGVGTDPKAFGITLPLITRSDGQKFGKSESGTVWLTADKTSPYELYQFFIRTPDADVVRFLKYFTFLSRSEIESIEKQHLAKPEALNGQKRLAEELVKLVHGEAALQEALNASQALFSGDLAQIDPSKIESLFQGAPTTEIPAARLEAGIGILDLLVETGLCKSKSLAKTDIEAGAISVNQAKFSDLRGVLNSGSTLGGQWIVLRKGKKNYHLLKIR